MTERTLSTTALNSMADAETEEVWLVLMTIDHEDLESALRVVNNIEEIVSNGETYVALPFEIDMPGDGAQGPTEARVKVDNVDRQIVEAIRTIQTPPTITLQVILASEPDDPEMTIEHLTLRDANYDLSAVTGALRFDDLTMEPISEKITPDRFPGLF